MYLYSYFFFWKKTLTPLEQLCSLWSPCGQVCGQVSSFQKDTVGLQQERYEQEVMKTCWTAKESIHVVRTIVHHDCRPNNAHVLLVLLQVHGKDSHSLWPPE